MSEVAGLIDQIETGGKGTVPFKYLEWVEVSNTKHYESPLKIDFDSGSYGAPDIKIKVKEQCMVARSTKIPQFEDSSGYVQAGEKTLEISKANSSNFEFICFGQMGMYQLAEMPDIIIFAPSYGG